MPVGRIIVKRYGRPNRPTILHFTEPALSNSATPAAATAPPLATLQQNPVLKAGVLAAIKRLPAPLDLRLHGLYRRLFQSGRDYYCRTAHGATMICRTDDYVQARILQFGVWEPAVTEIFRACVRPGSTFVDIGANVGYHTLLAAQLVGTAGQVIAIEPSPNTLRRLRRNIASNPALPNIRVIEAAVGATNAQIALYITDEANLGASTIENRGGAKIEALVRLAPLHDLLTTAECLATETIKIDIEGAEAPVIRSLQDNLHRYPRLSTIVVEVNKGHPAARTFAAGFPGFTARMLPDEELTSYFRNTSPAALPLADDGRPQFDLVLTRESFPETSLRSVGGVTVSGSN